MRAMERTYTLVVGRPVYIGEKPVNIEKYVNTNTGDAYKITDLHMEFEVKKDNSKEPNKGYITVYNLSDEMVNYLDQNQRESLAVMLHAGYNGDEKLIFSGTVEYVQDKFDDETRETKMILGDATLNLMTAQTARSYRKGTNLNVVLNDLISDLKLPKGRVVNFSGQTLQHSMAFSGTASQNLENLARNTGSTFSVQDGAVYWTREGSRFESTMFEISEEGGMIGSPTPKNPKTGKRRLAQRSGKETVADASEKKKAEVKEDAGLSVTTLLNGAILPESTIYLKSRRYTGFYKVVSLRHRGGFESGDWITEMDLSETRGELIK
ncbi:fatty oxidation complex, alpha subunit [Salmonella phage SSBI34]|nr:fatty oxidation complex, alpha subunit [Salmonella phage SSBI34]